MYYEQENMGKVIKEPFWVYFLILYEKVNWKLKFLNTNPKLSILIYEDSQNSNASMEALTKIFISTVLFIQQDTFPSHEILIWKLISSEFGELQSFCAYCNQCNPFQMITEHTTLIKFKQTSINGQTKCFQIT